MTLEQLRATWPVTVQQADGQDVEIIRTRTRARGGTPVLLLPGAQGTAESWFRQLLAWGHTRDMLCVNYPGLTDPATLADLVLAVADAQGLGRFDLIGSSYGGYLAQWIAARHGARVRRVVIGNSFHDPRPAQAPDRLAALQAKSADEVKAEAMGRLESAPDSPFRQVMLELVGRCQSAEQLRGRMLAVQMAPPAPAPQLPDDRLMLVECDNDPLISAPMREAIRARYPGAVHCAISGGGHYPYILRADAYNDAVAQFLDAI